MCRLSQAILFSAVVEQQGASPYRFANLLRNWLEKIALTRSIEEIVSEHVQLSPGNITKLWSCLQAVNEKKNRKSLEI